MKTLRSIGCVALGALFFTAGWLKWNDLSGFHTALAGFHLLPKPAIPLTAATLPALEMLCGGALVLGCWRRPALLGCALMGAGFVGALGWGISTGLVDRCGCFGAWDPLAGRPWLSFARAAAFLAWAAGLYLVELARIPLAPVGNPAMSNVPPG